MRIRESASHGIVEGSGIGGVEVNCSRADVSVAVQGDVVPGVIIEPQVGMEFESDASAKAFYDEYARRVGFSPKLRVRPDGSALSREFVCCKEGPKKRKSDLCEAMLMIEVKEGNKWVVMKFVKEHNHPLESHYKGQNSQPRGQSSVVVPTGVMYVNIDGNHGNRASTGTNHGARNVSSNCLNYVPLRPCPQRRTFGKDGQNMLDYFKKMQAENPGFFYAIQLDDDNRMTNAFWSDARSKAAYGHFGDVVILDTSHTVNQYIVPFAPFTGVNHHGEPILFGCALLLDDSEASYVWLLRAFLTLGGRPPVSIVTDKNRAIQGAVTQVLPNTRHCISKLHVLKEGQDKLARVCLAYPNFRVDLYNCINLTYTIEEFESSWALIIDKYDLSKNDWLQSIYNTRREWVPVYFRDSFFAAVSLNHGVGCSFFEGHVNQQTTLPLFFRQYERAMEYWFEKEIEADFDTISKTPVLKTPSPMEKQASDLYTRKIFAMFQEELVETFAHTANRIDGDDITSTYQVANYEDDHKSYTVTFNISDLRAVCSCMMFEYSGILCRHILTVFTVTNVLTLPTHYILTRWTRNAKSVIASGELGSHRIHESRASRYNSLCREAIRYALEGATTSESYYAAVTALQEGGRKIDLAKKSVGNIATQIPEVGTIGYDDNTSSGADTPSLWPQQDEGALRFNLNDSAILPHPVSDMSLIRMAPMTLQRNNGPSDNMAVLPCLKSMTWVMENRNSTPANRVAIINLKLQDFSKSPVVESEVKFQLSRATLEPMLRSMAYISEQLSTPANRVAVINLKLQDTQIITGESEVKFQVSRDTLGAMLRSMAYIREQLPFPVDQQAPAEPLSKKQRK